MDFNSMFWAFIPAEESIEDIVNITKPEGKDVFGVCSFGFPLAFLAAGANSVVSCDVDEKAIAWNSFLKDCIRYLDYEENEAIISNSFSGKMRKKIFDKLSFNCDGQRMKKHNYSWQQYMPKSLEEDLSSFTRAKYYPHVQDQKTFEMVKANVNNWEIHHKGMRRLLEKYNNKFEIIHGSSVRNWVLCFRYNHNKDNFKEYDERLARAVTRALKPEGIYYDLRVNVGCFPMEDMPEEFYSDFEFSRHEPSDPDMRSHVVIAKKKEKVNVYQDALSQSSIQLLQ